MKRALATLNQDAEAFPKKRLLVALAAAAVVFGAVYAVAASLNLTTDTLGAGTATVAACQSATLTASYAPSYSAALPGYTAGTVTVSGLQASCYGKNFRLTLSGAGNASLGEVTGTTPTTGSTFTANFASAGAAAVTGIALVIEG
jgi:uncharacterized membrane protein (UPF0136 family)